MLIAAQVAPQLGLSVRAVYDLAASGAIPSFRVGAGKGAVRFEQADIDAYKLTCRSAGTRASRAGWFPRCGRCAPCAPGA